MYEIYINDRLLRLASNKEIPEGAWLPRTHLLARYTGKVKTLLHYADLLEKASPKVTGVTLVSTDLGQLWEDFKSHYKIVEAAGGIVNLKGTDEYLFIFRRGFLDLPKGKIDKGESKEQAALREVSEETGISPGHLNLSGPIDQENTKTKGHQTTLHTYHSSKGKRILKPTYWYFMETTQKALVPQAEEDIEWAKWMSWNTAMQLDLPFHNSLRKLGPII